MPGLGSSNGRGAWHFGGGESFRPARGHWTLPRKSSARSAREAKQRKRCFLRCFVSNFPMSCFSAFSLVFISSLGLQPLPVTVTNSRSHTQTFRFHWAKSDRHHLLQPGLQFFEHVNVFSPTCVRKSRLKWILWVTAEALGVCFSRVLDGSSVFCFRHAPNNIAKAM